MCGLVGVSSKFQNGFSREEVDTLLLSMFLNQLRGKDSTGLGVVTKKLEHTWCKIGAPFEELLRTKMYKETEERIFKEGKFVFAHARAATRGVINTENAHPFEVKKKSGGEIVLIHNGTLIPNQILPGFEKFGVDSHWIADCIAAYGYKESLEKIRGAIATIWWDSDKKRIYFYRNYERPLYYAKTNNQILLNSERESLIYLKHKFALHFEEKDIVNVAINKVHILDVESLELKTEQINDRPKFNYYMPEPKNQSKTSMYSHNLPRGYIEDAKLIRAGDILSVEWRPSYDRKTTQPARWTQINYNGWITTPNVPPYEEGLIRMFWNDVTKEVRKELFKDNVVSFETVVIPNEFSLYDEHNVLNNPEPGKEIRFQIKKGDKKIHHKVVYSGVQKGFLSNYQNNVDGKIQVGDTVTLEVGEIEEMNTKGLFKCLAFRVKEKMDKFIDFHFYSNMPKEEIEKIGVFAGHINTIELLPQEVIDRTGSVARVLVCNVKSLQ